MSLLLGTRRTLIAPRAGGWWDNNGAIAGCVAAYQPKGAADLAASYINLTGNATYNAAPGVAPTWDATGGWTFDGSSQYLTTGITPANTWSVFVRFSDASGTDAYLFGSRNGVTTTRFRIAPISAAIGVTYGNGGQVVVAPNATGGVLGMAGATAYRNGASDGSISNTWNDTGVAIFIGANTNGGAATGFIAAKIQALAIYSTTLTAGEVATLTTLMNNL